MDGSFIIDKPAGLTSHDVVARARRILQQRRIGHTGTLDPFATGVLVLLIGRATRLAQFLKGLDKEYEAVVRLGFATDTGDLTGTRLDKKTEDAESADWQLRGRINTAEIEAALANLRGDIDQVPPMYSAKKQQGRRLYELARRGEEVERAAARVCVRVFEAINSSGELLKDNLDGTYDLKTRVVCSSGTYVRTLAEDFGKQLGVGAHLAELRRTRVGSFPIGRASTLEQLQQHSVEESLGQILIPPADTLSHLPAVELKADDVGMILNGRQVEIKNADWSNGDYVRLRDEQGNLVAVASFEAEKQILRPRVVLAHNEK